MKQGCVLTSLFVKEFTPQTKAANLGALAGLGLGAAGIVGQRALKPKKKVLIDRPEEETGPARMPDGITLPTKIGAVHATGDALPKDWVGMMAEPTKENGGIGSYGADAWHSLQPYRYSWARPFNLHADWHVKKGKHDLRRTSSRWCAPLSSLL